MKIILFLVAAGCFAQSADGINTSHWNSMQIEQKQAVVRVAAQYFIGMVTSQATEKEIDQVVMTFSGVYPRLLEATNRYYRSNNLIAPYLKFMHNWMLEQLLESSYDFSSLLDRNGVQEIDPVFRRVASGQ